MWFEKDYRRIFMDMHLSDDKDEYLSKLDTDNFVSLLKEANVSTVVVKAKSHVGLHYWPSDTARMHNTLKKRNLDYVGEMINKCHQNNINVIVCLRCYERFKNKISYRILKVSAWKEYFKVRFGLSQ